VDQAARQQDNSGNPGLDGRSCDIIYDDKDLESRTRIVIDEDGGVVDMHVKEADADVWGGGWGVDAGLYDHTGLCAAG
jgi:hypothetical protein